MVDIIPTVIILNQYKGLNLTLTALEISDMEQANDEKICLVIDTIFLPKIEHLIKLIDIRVC